MITLITGVPGSGKTLYAINYIKTKSEKESRAVYCSGIPELTLGWFDLENAEEWYKCPAGSIIVIDECQRVFRPRPAGKQVPESISRFETHRHEGFDVFLITQHPQLIDTNIRRLVGQHFHVIRKFGLQACTVNEWASCHEINKTNVLAAVKHHFKYPKESFGWYKSAEVHTHKRNIPMRVWFVVSIPVLLLVLGFVFWQAMMKPAQMPEAAPVANQGSVQPVSYVPSGEPPNTHLSALEYITIREPRIEGFPHTAPVYDEVTKPVDAPVPVGCVDFAGTCRCYTQQGTRYETTQAICRDIVAKGTFFVDWQKDDSAARRQQEATPRQHQAQNVPESSASSPFVGSLSYEPPTLSATPTLTQ